MDASSAAVLSPGSSSSARQFWRFGLISGALALLWALGAAYGLGVNSALDALLCRQLAAGSAWLLQVGGLHGSVASHVPNLLLLNGQPSVIVGAPCDGLVLYALLIGFVLAYPGPALRRLWFIPLGIGALWLLNVVRIMALAVNHQYSPATFDFNHHYAFSAVAYAALGGLWLLWTRQGNPSVAPAAPSVASAGSVSSSFQPTRAPWQAKWLTAKAIAGLLLLLGLILINSYQDKVIGALSTTWAWLLATGPAWLARLPGATAADVPGSVSHLPVPVGATFTGLFLLGSVLCLRLLLPSRTWRLVWRSYAGLLLACVLLLGLGRAGAGATAYHLSRMLLDFMVSVLPVVGLLVLLWRPPVGAQSVARASTEPAER